jgi:hypothetical protein
VSSCFMFLYFLIGWLGVEKNGLGCARHFVLRFFQWSSKRCVQVTVTVVTAPRDNLGVT